MSLSHRTGQVIRELYRIALSQPPDMFKDRALETIKSLIPFDAALWAIGALIDNKPVSYSIHFHKIHHDAWQDYIPFMPADPLLAKLVSHNNEVQAFSMMDAMPRQQFVHSNLYQQYCRKYAIEHLMATAVPIQSTGLFTVISLYRNDPAAAFDDSDKAMKTFLAPILLEACNINLLRGAQPKQQSVQYTSAVCDVHGHIHKHDTGFLQLMRKAWPEWQPNTPLPLNIASTLAERSRAVLETHGLVIHLHTWHQMVKIHARNRAIYDELTSCEKKVAHYMIAGLSNKEIALQLGLSPKTIGHHLQNIYKKTGCSNRLQAMTQLYEFVQPLD